MPAGGFLRVAHTASNVSPRRGALMKPSTYVPMGRNSPASPLFFYAMKQVNYLIFCPIAIEAVNIRNTTIQRKGCKDWHLFSEVRALCVDLW